MIERHPEEVLELYFRQCALSVTACDLAIMAATLANDGTIQPDYDVARRLMGATGRFTARRAASTSFPWVRIRSTS